MTAKTIDRWITDRAPRFADADIDGDVVIKNDNYTEGFEFTPWQAVSLGEPWVPVERLNLE